MNTLKTEPMQEQKDHLDLAISGLMSRIKQYRDPPDDCPDEAAIAAYSEGRLSQGACQKLEAHLVACESCTMMRFALANDTPSTREVAEMYPAVVQRVKNRFTRRVERNWLDRLFFLLRRMWWIPVITVGVLVLLTAFIWVYRAQMIDVIAPAPPPAVSLTVVARKPSETLSGGRDVIPLKPSESNLPDYREVELASGGPLKPGEGFQLRFELTRPAYMYFFWADSSGQLRWLDDGGKAFPSLTVKPNRTYVFPAPDRWLKLNTSSGVVTLYLLAMPKPIEDPDDVLNRLEAASGQLMNIHLPNALIRSFELEIR